MNEFELKLGAITYRCRSYQSNGINNNWEISAQFNDLKVTMNIPIESKLSRSKCLLFIENFHEALTQAKKATNGRIILSAAINLTKNKNL